MLNLSRLDPNIVKIVVDKTAKAAVHNKENAFIEKDGRHRQERQSDREELKRKIRLINTLFEESEIDLYLSLEDEDAVSRLRILVREVRSDRLLTVLGEEELDRILSEIHSQTGIILDRKG